MLHEQGESLTLAGNVEAGRCCATGRGLIQAVGISTFGLSCRGVGCGPIRLFSSRDLSGGGFCLRLTESDGIGHWRKLAGNGAAARAAERSGLGVLGMKLFAGGHLLSQRVQAVQAALSLDFVTSWCVGMGTKTEIDINLDWFCGREPDQESLELTASQPRRLVIEDWCVGCGNCVSLQEWGIISAEGQGRG